jgi:hypothetical protein
MSSLRMGGTILPLPKTSSWRGAYLSIPLRELRKIGFVLLLPMRFYQMHVSV